jgi:hypothetical protein
VTCSVISRPPAPPDRDGRPGGDPRPAPTRRPRTRAAGRPARRSLEQQPGRGVAQRAVVAGVAHRAHPLRVRRGRGARRGVRRRRPHLGARPHHRARAGHPGTPLRELARLLLHWFTAGTSGTAFTPDRSASSQTTGAGTHPGRSAPDRVVWRSARRGPPGDDAYRGLGPFTWHPVRSRSSCGPVTTAGLVPCSIRPADRPPRRPEHRAIELPDGRIPAGPQGRSPWRLGGRHLHVRARSRGGRAGPVGTAGRSAQVRLAAALPRSGPAVPAHPAPGRVRRGLRPRPGPAAPPGPGPTDQGRPGGLLAHPEAHRALRDRP